MNGLVRRLEALEARSAPDPLAELSRSSYDSHQELGAHIMQLARRYADRTAPPIEQQSQVERIVRAALDAAAGVEGVAYARAFWRTVAAGLRSYGKGAA